MQLLRNVLAVAIAVLAVIGGLFTIALAALVALVGFLFRRPAPPAARARTSPHRPPPGAGDVIDVAATEVPPARES